MKYLAAFILLVALVVIGYFAMRPNAEAPAPVGKSFESAAYGISFFYPDGFVVLERDAGTAERAHHVITVVREAETVPPEGGEGPTAVTIDIYDNRQDQQTLMAWVTGSSFSNYKLGPQTHASTTVDGTESMTYRWSGLYEGETTAFVHGENIVAVSGTFMAPQDPIVLAYRMVLSTMELR